MIKTDTKNMILLLRLKDGEYEVSRTLELTPDSVTNYDSTGAFIEDMVDTLVEMKQKDLVLEAKRLTINND
jgi:hypothetical protein